MREQLEYLIGEEGVDAAEKQAQLARAAVAAENGASEQGILDALKNNRYIVRRRNGTNVTKYGPDLGTVMKTIQGISASDLGDEELVLFQAPSNPDGSIDEFKARVHAELFWNNGRWLIDLEQGGVI